MSLESIPGWLILTHVPYLLTLMFLFGWTRRVRRHTEALVAELRRQETER